MPEREFPDGTRIVIDEHPTGESEVLLYLNDKQVSRTVVIPMLIRIGAAVVRMDGIGGVGTDQEYRYRGYSRRVMETCVEQMKSGDAAISTLFGIEDFYLKFGYATAGPENTVSLPLPEMASDVASLPPDWCFRPFAAEDLPAVTRIYHQNTKHATGALMRIEGEDESKATKLLAHSNSAATRIGRRAWKKLEQSLSEENEDECRVLVDPSGKIVAYAWLGLIENWWMSVRREDAPDAFHFTEVMATNPMSADFVLAACLAWAFEQEKAFERIDMAIPPEGPVTMAAMYEGATISCVNIRRGDFMCRTLNTARLVRQMQPEFSARIQASSLEFCGQLTFKTEAGDGTLFFTPEGATSDDLTGGEQIVVDIPQDALARLCLGAFETGDLLARLPNRPSQHAIALLEVLFPKRVPHIYPMDRF